MYWSRSFILLTIVLLAVAAADTSVHTINITNGEQLKEYLCSPKRTIAPNTHLNMVHKSIYIANITNDCLVENTSNIVITSSSSCYNSEYPANSAFVDCNDYRDTSTTNTFSFFNVTNLTISCVTFNQCGSKRLPPAATKYFGNESDQVFEYGNTTWTTLFFNHCYNVTLYNVFADNRPKTPEFNNKISIVGVNLCGHSNITSVIPLRSLHWQSPITLSVYYVDSSIMSEDAECTLHIQSNMLSANKHANILKRLEHRAERFPVVPYRDLQWLLLLLRSNSKWTSI